jgi:hypothetical protein
VYNHTSKQTTKFHDHYEYTAFVAGKPDEKVLSPESSGGLTCSVAAEGTTSTEVATKRDTAAASAGSAGDTIIAAATAAAAASDTSIALSLQLAQPRLATMPKLPTAYSAVVEISKVASKETTVVREYLDVDSQRLRTDVSGGGRTTTLIKDFNTRAEYEIVDGDVYDDPYDASGQGFRDDDKCTARPLQEDPNYASDTRHMKSPHEVFMFASDGSEQYVGLDYARGIKCTQWYAAATETQVVNGHTLTVDSKRNHWFSAPGWSEAQTGGVQVPVRIVSEGTMYNHTSKQTTKFHDHYEYMSFIVGKPPLYMFAPAMSCADVSRGSSEQERDNALDLAGSSSKSNSISSVASLGADIVADFEAALGPRAMPSLPDAYSVVVEMSRVQDAQTRTVHQFLDFGARKVRTDVHDNGKVVSVVRDFAAGAKYILTADISNAGAGGFFREMNARDGRACVREPLTAATAGYGDYLGAGTAAELRKTMFAAKTRHMKSPHEVFMFDSDGDEQYVGEDYARGIECTQWYAQGTETEEIGGHTITTTAKRNHWFSTKDWSDAGCMTGDGRDCFLELPVRTVSEGTVYNHTSKQTTKFHDHYEYMSFIVGKPPTYMFDVSTVCPGAKAPADDTATEAPPSYGSKGSTSGGESGNLRTSSDGSKTATDLATGGGKSDESTGTKVGLAVGVAFSILVGLVAVAAAVRKRGRDRGSGKGRRNSSAPLFGGRRFSGGGATELIDEDVPDFGNVTSSSAGSSSSSSKGRSRRGLSIRSNQAISMPVVQSGILQAVVGSAQIVDDPNLGSSSSSDSSSFRSHDLPCAV